MSALAAVLRGLYGFRWIALPPIAELGGVFHALVLQACDEGTGHAMILIRRCPVSIL